MAMGLKRWTGSGYEDVNLAQHRAAGQYVARTPTAAYVWDGGQYKQVWPSSPYPLSGSWGPLTTTGTASTTRDSHTIAENGSYTLTHILTSVDGAYDRASIQGPWGVTDGPPTNAPGKTSTATTTRTLTAGNVINFQSSNTVTSSFTVSGTWSIVKN